MNAQPCELEKVYTLQEAAAALGVTCDDVADPARWLRDKIRALRVPYVRAGRVVKLPESSLHAMREAMTVRDVPATSSAVDLPELGGRSASTLHALARLGEMKRTKSTG